MLNVMYLKKCCQMEVSLFQTCDKGAINNISFVEIFDICFVLSWHGHAFVRPNVLLQTRTRNFVMPL